MTVTSAQILRHTTAFISETLLNSELLQRLVSTLYGEASFSDQINLKALSLAAETVQNAIETSNNNVHSSSLRFTEKRLLALPENPFSSFLLSFIYSLWSRPVDAAINLLQVFYSSPSLARSEIAPVLFEELFSVNFFPVFEWFNEQRTEILSLNLGHDENDFSIGDESVVVPSSKSLSKMSGDQALELRKLERDYEQVIDQNCRIFAQYFIEVLKNENGDKSSSPPLLILKNRSQQDRVLENIQVEEIGREELPLKNGRYNPIWAGADTSIEFLGSSTSDRETRHPEIYPQRVSPRLFRPEKSPQNSVESRNNPSSMTSKNINFSMVPKDLNSDYDYETSLDDNLASNSSSFEYDIQTKEQDVNVAFFKPGRRRIQEQKKPVSSESSRSRDYIMADYDNPPGSGKHTPPKDFVCPITSNIFDDPVTLETGQTYERKAIQEWFSRGNATCPITRQKLHSTQLPKTNYVLKRLIASWQEQNPKASSLQSENPYPEAEPIIQRPSSTSPNSVILQANTDRMISELRHAVNNLYMSEVLEESEKSVIKIEQFWKEIDLGVDMQNMLSKPPVINGFMEILFNSVDTKVLQATVFLLIELVYRDSAVIQTLTQVDSDVECIVALFKKGLMEAIVLLYFLKPSSDTILDMDILDSLVEVIKMTDEEFQKLCMKPKTASMLLLSQIFGDSDESIVASVVKTIFSRRAVENIMDSMEADWTEERISAVRILLRCIKEDGRCRNIIADKAVLIPVLDSFICQTDKDPYEIIQFFSELAKLNRRTLNEQVLHIIKEEGAFSTMHTLLIYLQTAVQDKCPTVAGLLLQLDLLIDPRKMSLYREEAMDSLISCLRNNEFPDAQIAAAETILSLQGRFTVSGKPLTRAFLLKRAGMDRSYKNLVTMDDYGSSGGVPEISQLLHSNLDAINACISCFSTWNEKEEEKAADAWEKKMASVLACHEFGLIFEALAEGLQSRYADLRSACFISATWLINMLAVLPDTGVQGAARVCLLKHFISVFVSSKDPEDKAISMLAIKSFTNSPEGLRDLSTYTKDILKGLRELKKSSRLASELLKVLSEGNETSADLWNHKELAHVDCTENGEVLSVVCCKDKVFSGHSDGTIKVWTVKGSILHLLQDIREHVKAVTSLSIAASGEKLYSGSMDRTVKAWSVGKESMRCVQIYDMKDQVHNLVVANSIACFIPQSTGVKVQSWNGGSKLLNANKYAKSLALLQGKLYCGCYDNSIQEIDLASETICTIQSGSRKLLGKSNPIHSLQVCDGVLYAAGTFLDGAAVKMWSTSNYNTIGMLPTASEVRSMTVSSELIYLGCKGGAVEIWDKKKHSMVDTLQTGTNGRVLCMAVDGNEEILLFGTSDGRIRAWEIN